MSIPRAYQRCVRCVMDTTDTLIAFSSSGECNHCSDYIANRLSATPYSSSYQASSNLSLSNFFNKIKSKSSKRSSHDVLVGVSGGVDSSSVVLLAQKAGLRVLAVHMDNCWNTPIAVQNIYKLLNLSGVDYFCEVLDWNNFKKVQRAFFLSGVADLELPTDIAIQAVLHRVAHQYGIKVILSGGNIASEGILPSTWLYNARDSLYSKSILLSAGIPVATFNQLSFGLRSEVFYRLFSRIKTLYPLNLYPYDKQVARHDLINAISWVSYGGNHCESIFTRFAHLIYLPRRHNIDYRLASLSANICLGKVSRTDALEQLKLPPWEGINVSSDMHFVAAKLGFTFAELERLTNSPGRYYFDYPNRQHLLSCIYQVYRCLNGTKKLSNF